MTSPWWLSEKGYQVKLAEGRVRVGRRHESFAKRLFWGAVAAFLAISVLAIHVGKEFLRLRRKRG